jgi:hypothetical protein
MGFKETGSGDMDWIQLLQNRICLQTFVNTVTLYVPQNQYNSSAPEKLSTPNSRKHDLL